MLKILDAPPLDAGRQTTYWIGDPAIDRQASDVARWCIEGDAESLVVRAGQTPSAIVWRPIDEWERGLIPSIASGGLRLHLVTAARIGLLSIDGYELRRPRERGHVDGIVPMDQALALRELRAEFGYGLVVDAALVAEFEREPDLATRTQEGEITFPEWLGAVILAHSFPRR